VSRSREIFIEIFIETFIEIFTDSESFNESFNKNFTTSWHHTWKFGKTINQKVDTGRKFRYFRGRYDTIPYIDIKSIFSIYRSITTAADTGVASHAACQLLRNVKSCKSRQSDENLRSASRVAMMHRDVIADLQAPVNWIVHVTGLSICAVWC